MIRIRPVAILLTGAMALLTVGAIWASSTGLGLARPEKNPPSIREESTRGPLRVGRRHGHFYFVGGGIHRGK